jgi:AraC-like DNA-binding protein
MPPALFKKYLPGDSLIFEMFQQKIDDGYSSLMVAQNHLVNLQMFGVIQDIIHCERKGMFKKMFLEAKVMELLLLQLEQFCDHNTVNPSLRKSDIEKIYAVRDFILNNLTKPCSLMELTQKVGTNEFILKKGFKALFGTTVFGFWSDAKMEEARKMLQTKAMNVSEVADAIGYKNQQHFTTAFKRKFGVVPSQVKGAG